MVTMEKQHRSQLYLANEDDSSEDPNAFSYLYSHSDKDLENVKKNVQGTQRNHVTDSKTQEMRKNQKEMTELKSLVGKMKNSHKGPNSRVITAENRTSQF